MTSHNTLPSIILARKLFPDSVIEAFNSVDRADFIRKEDRRLAYKDEPIPIGYHQTISQPYTVAFMLELLQVKPGHQILDIGTGSGWTVGLLSYITGESGFVYGLERIPQLVEFAQENLSKYPFTNYSLSLADPRSVGIEGQNFDRILVSAAAQTLPTSLIDQLKEGGVLVVPVNDTIFKITKKNGAITKKKYSGFNFVPLITN